MQGILLPIPEGRPLHSVFALPLNASAGAGMTSTRSRVIKVEEFTNSVVIVAAAPRHHVALYPLAAVSNNQTEIARAGHGTAYHAISLAYHAGTKQLTIAYDFGLARETAIFR